MDYINIVVAVPKKDTAHKIKNVLIHSGYHVPDICTSANEAIRKVRQSPPDILLINFEMHDMTGLEVARIVGDENLCSTVLMAGNAQRSYVTEAIVDYDITVLQKPLNKLSMLNTLDIVAQTRRRMLNLSRRLEKVTSDLENRKIIEKAKGILIKTKFISEGEAYRRIQKASMDNRVSMREVAERICEYINKI
jgi:two-component system, response regulator PdtaR